MDWTKAKTILIVALLITNIFLLILYNVLKVDESTNESEILAETVSLLEEKRIYIQGILPEEHPKMPVLIIEYDYRGPDEIEELISGQIQETSGQKNKRSDAKIAEDFLKKNSLWDSGIIISKSEKDGDKTTIYYQNEYEGILLAGSTMTCTVEKGKVSHFSRFWLKPVELGKSKKATISASAALINMMRSKGEEESIVVEQMDMVYWIDPSEYGSGAISDTALPAWRVTYNGGKTRFIPAYND